MSPLTPSPAGVCVWGGVSGVFLPSFEGQVYRAREGRRVVSKGKQRALPKFLPEESEVRCRWVSVVPTVSKGGCRGRVGTGLNSGGQFARGFSTGNANLGILFAITKHCLLTSGETTD